MAMPAEGLPYEPIDKAGTDQSSRKCQKWRSPIGKHPGAALWSTDNPTHAGKKTWMPYTQLRQAARRFHSANIRMGGWTLDDTGALTPRSTSGRRDVGIKSSNL